MRNRCHLGKIVLGVAGWLVATSLTVADTISLLPTQWNTIYSGASTTANGGGYHMFVGGGREGLLGFDVTAIPVGATITSAVLTMYMDRSQVSTPASQPIFMYRVTSSWGMGTSAAGASDNGINGGGGSGFAARDNDATWTYRFYNQANPASSIPWLTAGGDRVASASAMALVGSGFPTTGTQGPGGPLLSTWSGAGLVSDVQGWLDGTLANDGWLLSDYASAADYPPSGNAFGSIQARRFISPANNLDGTNGTSDDRPWLTVTYTVAPEPAAFTLLAMATVFIRRARIRGR